MMERRLSAHFMLSEFTASETAARENIDNTPSEEIIAALMFTAENLESVRSLLLAPLHITSGYRCPALNVRVGSKPTSAHVLGLAVDFICPSFGTPLMVCERLERSNIGFDQLIFEHSWVHIAFSREPRRQVLTLMRGGGYAHGIVKEAA